VLRETLNNLVRQRMDPRDFEVIVADDGSSDATKAVVESFSDVMTVKYCFQEDLGFRAGAARNAGARLAAAPLLVFVDTGVMIGPGFLQEHLAAHEQSPRPITALGYLYGFNPDASVPGLGDALDRLSTEEVVAHYDGDPAMRDVRHDVYVKCDFDMARLSVPWAFFFTNNCSMRAMDFWAAGAFDEAFHGWGGEDLEFGYRLFRHGLEYRMVPEAWGIEAPAERDMVTRMGEFRRNMRRFVKKYPEPRVEIGWATVKYYDLLQWEALYAEFAEWREQVRGLSVADEIDEVMRRVPAGDRIAILGAGGSVPASARNAMLLDFDADLLGRAGDGGPDARHHAIGLWTPLADRCVDAVIITSRLSGLRGRWNDALMAEAHRIGHFVLTTTTIAALYLNHKRISVRDDRAEAHVAALHAVDDVRDLRHRKDLHHGGDLPARHQGQGLPQVLRAVMSRAEHAQLRDPLARRGLRRPQRTRVVPTRSPTFLEVTSEPSATISPAGSCPVIAGLIEGMGSPPGGQHVVVAHPARPHPDEDLAGPRPGDWDLTDLPPGVDLRDDSGSHQIGDPLHDRNLSSRGSDGPAYA
jgi:GT2 family glycosyltransferase